MVDCKNIQSTIETECAVDNRFFTKGFSHNGLASCVAGSNNTRQRSIISNKERSYRINGMHLRDKLKQSLLDHVTHRKNNYD